MGRRRAVAYAVVLVVSLAVLGTLAVTADDPVHVEADEPYPGDTLVAVQAYGWFGNYNGEVFVVDRNGTRLWTYQPDDAAVFDAELLDDGNVMLSYGQHVPDEDCPEEWRDTPQDHCIRNVVEEVDPDTNERVWAYEWYDRFMPFHEVHDADRLENGETVVIDMGRHRTFTVNQDGEKTWEWSAVEHLGEGSAFWAEHVEGTAREDHVYSGPNQDWTHMNDVDRLPDGNFLMSIRNFDVVVEVDPETDEVVRVLGEPGNHSIMKEQHDPNYLSRHDTLVVADSENDRIVEYDATTMAEVWRYEGPRDGSRLRWPRDADRLPNGNTLIADSRNFRILEVNTTGDVVWGHDMTDRRAIVYDVDRLGPNRDLGEEPRNVPPGDDLDGTYHGGGVGDTIATVDSWIGFVLPHWVGTLGLVAILLTVGSACGLLLEGYRFRRAAHSES